MNIVAKRLESIQYSESAMSIAEEELGRGAARLAHPTEANYSIH